MKKMKKMKTIAILFLLSFTAWGQKYDGICQTTTKLGLTTSNLEFCIYKNGTFINQRYKNINEITNMSPEELITSQLSATNNEWLSINYGKATNWTKEQIEKLNNPQNKIELHCKLSFEVESIKFSLIKMNLYSNTSTTPISMALLLKKVGEKWIITENNLLANLGFVIMFTSTNDLYYIFNEKLSSSNSKINNLIKKVWKDNNVLNLNEVINEMGSLLMNFEYKEQPYTYSIKVLKDENIIIQSKDKIPYSHQSFCYYFDNENTSFTDQSTLKVLDYLKKENPDSKIFPLILLTYNNMENEKIFLFKPVVHL